MMNKFLITTFVLLLAIVANAQSAKVVLGSDGSEAIYLGESKTNYHVEIQDDGWVSKKGHKVVIYKAENGKGIVTPKNFGKTILRSQPSAKSKIAGYILYEEGYIPEVAFCLGKINGWYKVKTENGHVGYVPESQVTWNPINTY